MGTNRRGLITGLAMISLLFALSAGRTHAAAFSQGIQFVNKDNAGSFMLSLLKQISHPRCPHTDKEFYKRRTADTKKRHFGFTRHGFGQQGFTGSGRTDQERAFRNFAA